MKDLSPLHVLFSFVVVLCLDCCSGVSPFAESGGRFLVAARRLLIALASRCNKAQQSRHVGLVAL